MDQIPEHLLRDLTLLDKNPKSRNRPANIVKQPSQRIPIAAIVQQVSALDGALPTTGQLSRTSTPRASQSKSVTFGNDMPSSVAMSKDKLGSEVIAALKDKLGSEIAVPKDRLGSDIAVPKDKLGSEVAALKDKLGSEIAALKDKHGSEVAALKVKHGSAIAALKEKLGSQSNLEFDEVQDPDEQSVTSRGRAKGNPLPLDATNKRINRKEVMAMKQAMLEMLRKLDGVVDVLPPPDIAQPTITDMDALFRIVTDEQQVFDTVFQEMIRQISAHMVERGEILTEVRERYNRLFQRVPNHVKRIYFEAVAHRKIVKRLLQEFDRVREEVMTLMKEVALIGQFDRTIETHAHQLQLKVAHSFSSAETEEDTLGEYQTLYRLQSERMLIQLRAAEKERTMWMESASSLALQIARDHDVEELMIMQEKGRARMLAVQHVLAKIIGANEKEVGIIQNEVNMWRKHVNTISESLLGEDHSDIDRLAGVLRSMKQDFMVTSLNRPQEGILETENAVLEPASRADTKTVVEHLRSWLETISDVSDRYATDRNIEASEGLAQCRAHAERWIELARKTLYRCEHGVNGTEYHDRLSDLRVLSGDISSLLDNLEQRTTGENGVVKALFALQSQIEFRLNTLQARGHGRALNQAEATVLSDALDKWKRELTGVITTQSQYSQQSQSAVSDRIDEFLSKVVEQMQADTTARTEENNRLHCDMTRWMVMATDGGAEAQAKGNEALFALTHELSIFNLNLIKDAGDLEMVSDDHRNLRDVIRLTGDEWVSAAKAMIVRERKRRLELEARKTSSAETEAEDRRKLEAYVPPPALRNENFRITAADLQEFNALNKDLDFIFTSKMYLE